MKFKRHIALLLVAVTVLSLTGCGISKRYIKESDGLTTYYFGDKKKLKEFPEIPDSLNPQEIYDNLEYNEKMLYGDYIFDGKKEDFLKNISYAPISYVDYEGAAESEVLTSMPYEIKAGPGRCMAGQRNRDYEWASLSYYSETGYPRDVLCTYTVSGNTATFTPVSYYEILRDEEYLPTGLKYELGTTPITFTFSFRGLELTLSNGSQSVVLRSSEFTEDSDFINFSGKAAPNSPCVEEIERISCDTFVSGLKTYSSAYFYDDEKNYEDEGYFFRQDEMASYREDGLFTMVWTQEDENGNPVQNIRQFVAFVGGYNSLILTDGKNIYYYVHSEDSYLLETISQGMTDEELLQLEELDASQVEQIVQKKADLLEALSAAFEDAGLSVQINKETGEIAMDSTVLFDVNKADISQEGKALLSQFMQVYSSVVFNEEYIDFVSRILVEGHTDTNGTYELNQTLSQARADAVRNFCLSEESGVDAAYQQQLTDSLSAVGYSWDYPIYAVDGSVDMDASRRVAFRFIVNLNSAE